MRLKSSSMTVEVARLSIFCDRVLTSSSPPAAAEGSEGLPMYSHSCKQKECIVKYMQDEYCYGNLKIYVAQYTRTCTYVQVFFY